MMVLAGKFLLRKKKDYHDNKREMIENPLAIIAFEFCESNCIHSAVFTF